MNDEPAGADGGAGSLFEEVDFSVVDIRRELGAVEEGPPTFRRCVFAVADLTGLDLSGAVFEQCTLDGANLRDCRLDEARVSRGSFVRASFTSADLTDAVFDGVDLSHARFNGALLADARFSECKMIGADLTSLRGLAVTFTIEDCNLQLADFSGAHLRGLHVTGSDLTETDLRGADLRDAVFENCRLREADLSETRLEGADLRGADLGEITADTPRQLRGAVISARQAAQICHALGLTVVG
jgi:uncharacterized protein YjbI with pentapeptide repeats